MIFREIRMDETAVAATGTASGKEPTRFLLPSVRDLVFLVAFWALLIGPLSNRPLVDADIGWHIRSGEQILATRSVPRVDSFSSTMQGQPWIAWEWLYPERKSNAEKHQDDRLPRSAKRLRTSARKCSLSLRMSRTSA